VFQGLQVQTSLSAPNESGLREVLLKVCKGPCGLDKSTLEFGIRKDKKGREVLRTWCKPCEVLATQDYLRRKKLGLGPKPKKVVAIPNSKTCAGCKEDLALAQFRPRKRGLYGRYSLCGTCEKAVNQVYVETNREEINRRKRESWLATPKTEEQKKEAAGKARAWYKANIERAVAVRIAWVRSHPEKWLAISKRWRGRNPSKVAESVRQRRVILSKVENTLTTQEWEAIVQSFGGCCVYCGSGSKKITMDHIQPISKGGAHSKENVVPACKSCNSRKGAKDPALFEFVISPKPISHKFSTKDGA
jgi:hypothetical protein